MNVGSEIELLPLKPSMRIFKTDTSKYLNVKLFTSRRKVKRFSNALDIAAQEVKSVPNEPSSFGELLLKAGPSCL